LLERVHTNLYAIVAEAVDQVFHLERAWSKNEMVKRVVRYVYNAAKSQELLLLPWEQASAQLVENAMGAYCASCSEKNWCFELDLGQALASAAWELARATGQARSRSGEGPAVRFRQLKDKVIDEYEDKLDEALMSKAIWDATQVTFPDVAVQSKVNRALSKTHAKALEECLADTRPMPELQKVEQFTTRWMDSSMRQAWSSLDGGDSTISEGMVLRLFQNLIAPFGDVHPYSCIPPALIETIGRPPRDWQFLVDASKRLMASWRQELERPASAPKRRRVRPDSATGSATGAAGGEGPAGTLALPAHATAAAAALSGTVEILDSDDDDAGGAVGSRAGAEASRGGAGSQVSDVKVEHDPPEGHRECASGEDCVGRARDVLVRHWLEGTEGDLYCEACWRGLLCANPGLEGVWEDGPHAGEAYRDATHLKL